MRLGIYQIRPMCIKISSQPRRKATSRQLLPSLIQYIAATIDDQLSFIVASKDSLASLRRPSCRLWELLRSVSLKEQLSFIFIQTSALLKAQNMGPDRVVEVRGSATRPIKTGNIGHIFRRHMASTIKAERRSQPHRGFNND